MTTDNDQIPGQLSIPVPDGKDDHRSWMRGYAAALQLFGGQFDAQAEGIRKEYGYGEHDPVLPILYHRMGQA